MQRLLYFIANAMAAFMDFGIGALIGSVCAIAFGTQLSLGELTLSGVAAFLPDFDILLPLLLNKNPTYDHHETLMHTPLVMLMVATAVAALVGGALWAVIVFICVLWHYLHDTRMFGVVGGGGLAFLWPYSHQPWSPLGWEEREPFIEHKKWLREVWLRQTDKSVKEIGVGTAALFFALWMSGFLLLGVVIVALVWVGTFWVWKIQKSI
jgi:hypothetical protein